MLELWAERTTLMPSDGRFVTEWFPTYCIAGQRNIKFIIIIIFLKGSIESVRHIWNFFFFLKISLFFFFISSSSWKFGSAILCFLFANGNGTAPYL